MSRPRPEPAVLRLENAITACAPSCSALDAVYQTSGFPTLVRGKHRHSARSEIEYDIGSGGGGLCHYGPGAVAIHHAPVEQNLRGGNREISRSGRATVLKHMVNAYSLQSDPLCRRPNHDTFRRFLDGRRAVARRQRPARPSG